MSIALNIPASNSTGAASDVSSLDPQKTFVIGGTLAPGEQIVIEATADPAGAAGWAGIAVFAGSQGNTVQTKAIQPASPTAAQSLAPNAVEAVVNWMRVKRISPTTSPSAPTVSVDSTTTATKVFQAIAVPAGTGSGANTDISAQGTSIQATVSGVFGPNEQVLLEGSIDGGVSYDTIFAFTGPGTQARDNCRYSLVRTTRQGVGNSAQTIQLFLGTCTAASGGGGGAAPYNLDPENVDNSLVGPGAVVPYSRGDHVHGLTFSDETTVSSVEPSTTPTSPGVSQWPARADHVHNLADSIGTFGENTILEKLNGAGILKTILQLIAQYNDNTNGSEATAWLIKVLQAGAQVNGQIITGQGTIFPAGFFDGNPANTRTSVALEDQSTGFKKEVGLSDIAAFYAGVRMIAMSVGMLNIPGTFAKVVVGSTNDGSFERTISNDGTVANVGVVGRFGGVETNVEIGSPVLLARAATGGFLDIPVIDDSAGPPTGTPKFGPNKASLCFGRTTLNIYAYDTIGARWLKLSAPMIAA